MMKRVIISFFFLLGLSGCGSFRNAPWVAYFFQTNEMVESLCPGKDHGYSIYEYTSPFVGLADNEEHLPAHYQILLPPQTDIMKMYERGDNRCFVYSKSRGIAIIQEPYSWRSLWMKRRHCWQKSWTSRNSRLKITGITICTSTMRSGS